MEPNHAEAGDKEALETATEDSPELFEPAPTTPFELRPDDAVGQYLSAFSARVVDRAKKPQGLITWTIPLRVKDVESKLEPTTSRSQTGHRVPLPGPVVPVEYPADVSDPIPDPRGR